MLCLMQELCVSLCCHTPADSRTPQKCCELLCPSPRDPGRTCLFKNSGAGRKGAVPQQGTLSLPIMQSNWSTSGIWFKISSELAWSYGRGAQVTAQKPGVASQNNPSSPQHISCLLSPLMRVLGLMHFLQGPKNSAKTESQSAACCWGTPGRSTRHSARMPQEQRMATGNTLHPPLPSSQLSLWATLHTVLFPVQPIPLSRQTPHEGANTPTSAAKAAAADGNMKQSGQLRKACRESCSAFLCLPVPHKDLLGARGQHPSGLHVCSQQ